MPGARAHSRSAAQLLRPCHPTAYPGAAAPAAVLAAVEGHVKARRKVLVHCWGGGGRTGLVQAAWLARAQGLSAADAAAAVTAHAKAAGVPRRVDVAALEAFLQKAAPAAAT
jgi:protein-tyrosine phosphatase